MNTNILTGIYADLHVLHAAEYRWHQKATGNLFHDVHLLTERFYEETEKHFHDLGERIAFLNGPVPAHPKKIMEAASIAGDLEAGTGDIDAKFAAECNLVAKNELTTQLVEAINSFHDDAVTEDLLIEITREQEEHMYLLKQLVA